MEPCQLIAIWIPINNPPKNVAVGLVSESQTVLSPSVRLPHLGFVAGAPEGVGLDDAGNWPSAAGGSGAKDPTVGCNPRTEGNA